MTITIHKIKHILLLFALITFNLTKGQNTPQANTHGLVNWISIEEAEKRIAIQPKPVIVDVYTDWCGWCKRMIQTTYSDKQVADYINRNYYPVKYNAESKDTIIFMGDTLVNSNLSARRASHQLTYKWMPGKRSYPTTLFFDNNFQFSLLIPGYLNAKQIAPFLVYTAEDMYQYVQAQEYQQKFEKTFNSEIKDTSFVKWHSLQDAINLNKINPKKIFIHMFANGNISSTIMEKTSYNHQLIADYLNNNFYPVKFNAQSMDTLLFNDQTITNSMNSSQLHNFTISVLNNKYRFPSIIFLNKENSEPITVISEFMTPKTLEPVLEFFDKDIYKTKKWTEFHKNYVGKIK